MAVVFAAFGPRPSPAGAVVVYASSRGGGQLLAAGLTLGGHPLALRAGAVPAAPDTVKVAESSLAPGRYRLLVAGRPEHEVAVQGGLVTPVLLDVESGQVANGGVYVGGADYGLGLNELAGKLTPLPEFSLHDQAGGPLNRQSLAGHDVVIAAFHTTCHETCPLFTGVLFKLRQQAPNAMLVEVTTDPLNDSSAALSAYRAQVGADWTFATGSPEELSAFWYPFGVQLSASDSHTSVMALVDSHGFLRATYTGSPDLGGDLPGALRSQLSPAGQQLLAGHGQGWGTPQVLDQLRTIAGLGLPAGPSGAAAPDFSLASTDGSRDGLAQYRGRPVLINFWSATCPPCRAEMPLIQQESQREPGLVVLLVDSIDSASAAHQFLDSIHLVRPALLDQDGHVAASYRVAALPTTVFVRPDGTEEGRWPGALTQAVLASHVAAIEGR